MGVDYGDARTGVAFSDLSGSIAGEAFTITMSDMEKAADLVTKEAGARGVTRIVLGYPKNMNGTKGPRAEKSEAFAEMLRARIEAEVLLWDERLTSVNAHAILSENGRRGKARKEKVDAVAASLILQSYLDSRRGRE
jgi:putative Holliday junction resolvase